MTEGGMSGVGPVGSATNSAEALAPVKRDATSRREEIAEKRVRSTLLDAIL